MVLPRDDKVSGKRSKTKTKKGNENQTTKTQQKQKMKTEPIMKTQLFNVNESKTKQKTKQGILQGQPLQR